MSDFITNLSHIKVASSNSGVRTTDQFENIDGEKWIEQLKLCSVGTKDGTHWLRTALKHDESGRCMPRSNDNTESLARVLIIDCDKRITTDGEEIDGAPNPQVMSDILKQHDIGHVIHGSYSHYSGKTQRCRIVLITNVPYKQEQLPQTAMAIVSLINAGLTALGANLLAYATENNTWAQPWFFPRKPSDCIAETLFIEHMNGGLIEIVDPIMLPPTSHTLKKSVPSKNRRPSPIESFNKQNNIVDLLDHYGYERVLPNKWLSPESTSGCPGITVRGDKIFSHHNDQLNDGYWHDAFDLMRASEGLDEHEAIIKAAQNTMAPDGRTIDEYNKRLPTANHTVLAQLLPDSRPQVMQFKPEMLPESIRDFILDVAARQQSQPDFVAVTAIVALSSLLGRKALICPKQHDDWTVTPNQWGAIIGRPSAMKSPSMNEALKPLREIEARAAVQHTEDQKNYDEESILYEMEKLTIKEAVKRALKVKDRVAAREACRFESNQQPPIRERFIVNDATVEKLGVLLSQNKNGLILVRDELAGLLAKLSTEACQGERAFYLECFDGNGTYTVDRIERGTINIDHCTLSIIGGIQPTKIATLVRDAMTGTADDGFIQRFQLASWPDNIGSWEWLDRAPNQKAKTAYYATFNTIHNLAFDTDDGEPPCFRFTPEAQLLFITWMEEIQLKARAEDIHPAIESHMLKMPQTIAGLALLFELIDGGRETVGDVATARALEWADYLVSHANRLYSIAINQSIDNARLILKRKNKLGSTFTAREIHRKNWSGLDNINAVTEAIECLIDYKHLVSIEQPINSIGGRPSTIYQWTTHGGE